MTYVVLISNKKRGWTVFQVMGTRSSGSDVQRSQDPARKEF